MLNFTASQLILGSLFGTVGFVVFMFGKKQVSWKPMAAGAALIVLPYLVQETVALCSTGLLILAALYIFRD